MSKTIKAKFKCTEVRTPTETSEQVKFGVVTTGSKENETFSKFTPSGSLDLTITNEELLGHFKVDKEYFVNIVEA